MGKLVRRRPSPAMVVGLVGLIAATSGNAVADGVKAVASVVGKDQVTSKSVKDDSLLLRDLKRSERAKLKGAKGPRGANGDAGASGLGTVVRKSAPSEVPAAGQTPCPGTPANSGCYQPVAQHVTATVSCDPGQVAIGGGVAPDAVQDLEVNETHPTPDGNGWTATVGNDDVTRPHRFDVVVLCAAAHLVSTSSPSAPRGTTR